jgi:hypothetical protein
MRAVIVELNRQQDATHALRLSNQFLLLCPQCQIETLSFLRRRGQRYEQPTIWRLGCSLLSQFRRRCAVCPMALPAISNSAVVKGWNERRPPETTF